VSEHLYTVYTAFTMSENDNLSSLSKIIPTLAGTDNFVTWRRALKAYLLEKGALRVLEGRETEPFRLMVPLASNVAHDGPIAGAKHPMQPILPQTVTLRRRR
jgi:hypothetical protein